jgi:RND superfamily putative drug exporter
MDSTTLLLIALAVWRYNGKRNAGVRGQQARRGEMAMTVQYSVQPPEPAAPVLRPLEWYGLQVCRVRWLIIGMWIALVALGAIFGPQAITRLNGGGFSLKGSESDRAAQTLTAKFGATPVQVIAVFTAPHTAVSAPAYQAQVQAFIRRARGVPHVAQITPAGVGHDGRSTYVTVDFTASESATANLIPKLQGAAPAGPATILLTGEPAIDHFTIKASDTDAQRAELYTFPIALVVLLLVFGTLVAAGMPLAMGAVAIALTLAGIFVVASYYSTSVFILNTATMIGLGISIDYSLFMVSRFRDELRARPVDEAVARTVGTAGEAILFSGLAVIIGFAALCIINVPVLTSIAIGGALVVAASVLAAMSFLPALLALLGPRINAVRVAPWVHTGRSLTERGGIWHQIALTVMRRPWLVIAGVLLLIGALAWPVYQLQLGVSGANLLPADSAPQRGLNILYQQFGQGNFAPVLMVVQTSDGGAILRPASVGAVYDLTRAAAAVPNVARVQSLTSGAGLNRAEAEALYGSGAYARDLRTAAAVARLVRGNTTLITVTPRSAPDTAASRTVVQRLRALMHPGLRALVGGSDASGLDFTSYLYGRFPWAIGFIVLSTYLVLFALFRSVLLPLKAVLMNLLSIAASYGVVVYVFQMGVLSGPLGFTPPGEIEVIIPILMLCILFGLSMDYEVFLLSVVREEYQRTGDNTASVAFGLERTGRIITSAAAIMVIVAGAFSLAQLLVIKEIGVGMAVAIAIDATVIRALLVPATMRLLGRWNWWRPGKRWD